MQIEAKKVNEEAIKKIKDFYVLIYDTSTGEYKDLINAVNLFHVHGWTCVNITATQTQWHWRMYALMHH